jgi:hypothetical protein
MVICRGSRGDKSNIIRNCHCDEFRPYRIAGGEEDNEQAIENQDTEVIQG